MRKIIYLIILTIFTTSCGILFPWAKDPNYPMTTFFVQNSSDVAIEFEASVLKYSTISPPYELNQFFVVKANETIMVRKVRFNIEADPPAWFVNFIISTQKGLKTNNPSDPNNWIKGIDSLGKPTYTFTIAG